MYDKQAAMYAEESQADYPDDVKPVRMAMDRLKKELALLNEDAQHLRDRLKPLLMPQPPSEKPEGLTAVRRESSDHVRDLLSAHDSVAAVRERLVSTLRELEI